MTQSKKKLVAAKQTKLQPLTTEQLANVNGGNVPTVVDGNRCGDGS